MSRDDYPFGNDPGSEQPTHPSANEPEAADRAEHNRLMVAALKYLRQVEYDDHEEIPERQVLMLVEFAKLARPSAPPAVVQDGKWISRAEAEEVVASLAQELQALRLVHQEARELVGEADATGTIPAANLNALRSLLHRSSRIAATRAGAAT